MYINKFFKYLKTRNYILGPEYGTTEAAWKSALVEAERRCDMHLRVRDRLVNDVISQIKTWQKDNYHKSMMTLKERKEMDESFKKVLRLLRFARFISYLDFCLQNSNYYCFFFKFILML